MCKNYYSLFIFFAFTIIYAKSNIHDYVKAQVDEIAPNAICEKLDNQISCNIKNVEWIEGVLVKDFTYNATLNNDIFTRTRNYILQTQNLNFEGYNLAPLMPDYILCKDISHLQKNKNTHNTIEVKFECTLESPAYFVEFTTHFTTTHPMYKMSETTIDALNIEHNKFIQPIHTIQEQTWKNDYHIRLKSLTFSLKSHSLDAILFNLYKREQRIANNENSQNDKDYRMTQDSTLLEDYRNFLKNLHQITNNINLDKVSEKNKIAITQLIHSFTEIATQPNHNLLLSLQGNVNFTLSLAELEYITDINDDLLYVITKILQNTEITVVNTL